MVRWRASSVLPFTGSFRPIHTSSKNTIHFLTRRITRYENLTKIIKDGFQQIFMIRMIKHMLWHGLPPLEASKNVAMECTTITWPPSVHLCYHRTKHQAINPKECFINQ